MVQRFKVYAGRSDSKSLQDMPISHAKIYLNDGMMQLLKQRYSGHNQYQTSLEQIQKRIDEWQRLIVPHELLKTGGVIGNSIYPFKLKETKKPYLFLLRCSFLATKGSCNDQKLLTQLSVSDSLDDDLDNPDLCPNFDWRRTLHRFSEDRILAYSDGTFKIGKADIDYLRYPQEIDLAGIRKKDGKVTVDADCELPEFLHTEIVNEAVLVYKFVMNHPDSPTAQAIKQIQE